MHCIQIKYERYKYLLQGRVSNIFIFHRKDQGASHCKSWSISSHEKINHDETKFQRKTWKKLIRTTISNLMAFVVYCILRNEKVLRLNNS